MTADTVRPFRVRFQVVGHPNDRDTDREMTYRADTPIHQMFRWSEPGAQITQVHGTYVRTWTLIGEVTE